MNQETNCTSPLVKLLALTTLLLAACTSDTPDTAERDAAWSLACTRADLSDPVLLSLRYDGADHYGTLVPTPTEAADPTFSWKNSTPPNWPDNNSTPVELITFYPCPSDGTLPATLTAGTTLHQAGYTPCDKTHRPTSFSLTHLMGQLRVHIRVNDADANQYQPQSAQIELQGSGTADYPHLRLLPTGDASPLALGTFMKEPADTEGGEQWVTEQTFVIIPQTLRQGEPYLTFTAGTNSYVFIPEKDVPLLQGKLNHLTLGIATKPDGSQEVQLLEVQSVSIGDWSEGGELGNGEAT